MKHFFASVIGIALIFLSSCNNPSNLEICDISVPQISSLKDGETLGLIYKYRSLDVDKELKIRVKISAGAIQFGRNAPTNLLDSDVDRLDKHLECVFSGKGLFDHHYEVILSEIFNDGSAVCRWPETKAIGCLTPQILLSNALQENGVEQSKVPIQAH